MPQEQQSALEQVFTVHAQSADDLKHQLDQGSVEAHGESFPSGSGVEIELRTYPKDALAYRGGVGARAIVPEARRLRETGTELCIPSQDAPPEPLADFASCRMEEGTLPFVARSTRAETTHTYPAATSGTAANHDSRLL